MAAGDILIRWVSESGAAVRDMARVEKALKDNMTASEKWGRRWQTASAMALKAGTAMAGAIAVEAVRAGKAAAVQEQAIGGLQAVFKDQAPAMESWARGMSDMGLSMTDTAQYAARLGSSLKGAGLELGTAADQTRRLTELGADLAATYGGTTADAVAALGAALRGEYDPLEQFGAALTAAQVEAELAATGQDKLTGSARAQAEMAARLKLIWEKTADAQGQSAREADTSAAAYERFMAKLANVEADLGTALLPLMEDLAGAAASLADTAEQDPEKVRTWAKAITGLAAALLLLGTAGKAVTVIQGFAAAVKAMPKLGPLPGLGLLVGGLTALKELKAPDDSWPRFLAEFVGLKPPDLYGTWVQPLKDLFDWMQGFETSGVWRSMRLGLAQVTDALGITQNRYEQLKQELSAPIQAKITAANRDALGAAQRAQTALRRVADGRYRAQIDASEDRARAAANRAQNAIDRVRQHGPVPIDANAQPAMDRARAVAAAIEAMTVVMTVTSRVQGVGARALAGAPAARSLMAADAPAQVVNIDRLVLEVKTPTADPVTFARQVRGALTGDEIRTGRAKVVR